MWLVPSVLYNVDSILLAKNERDKRGAGRGNLVVEQWGRSDDLHPDHREEWELRLPSLHSGSCALEPG